MYRKIRSSTLLKNSAGFRAEAGSGESRATSAQRWPSMTESTKLPVIGATPEGASDARSAARAVREMFTAIAARYDLLNHVLSFNIDRLWWRRTARKFRPVLSRPEARVLDLCCGTGDMTFALRRQARSACPQILGADFSHAMLQRARVKSADRSLHTSRYPAP